MLIYFLEIEFGVLGVVSENWIQRKKKFDGENFEKLHTKILLFPEFW
jgi:hypothetical protein